jgi:hypothetical protein
MLTKLFRCLVLVLTAIAILAGSAGQVSARETHSAATMISAAESGHQDCAAVMGHQKNKSAPCKLCDSSCPMQSGCSVSLPALLPAAIPLPASSAAAPHRISNGLRAGISIPPSLFPPIAL